MLYTQKSTEGGIDYCQRKVKMLQEQLEKLAGIVNQKQHQSMQIVSVMEAKMKQQK